MGLNAFPGFIKNEIRYTFCTFGHDSTWFEMNYYILDLKLFSHRQIILDLVQQMGFPVCVLYFQCANSKFDNIENHK